MLSQRGPTGRRNYLYDAQGSVVGLTDPDGALRTRYSYDPYGHPSNLDEIGDPNPFGWRGAYTAGVGDDGVLCGGPNTINGAFYDAEDGRFTSLLDDSPLLPGANGILNGFSIFDSPFIDDPKRVAESPAAKFLGRATGVTLLPCFAYKSVQPRDTKSLGDDLSDLGRCTGPGFFLEQGD